MKCERGKTARDDKEEHNARFICAEFDTGANGVLNNVSGSRWADLGSGYFRLLKAFRIMPVKMLNIPAIMNRVVSIVLPRASSPDVVAILSTLKPVIRPATSKIPPTSP